MLRFPDHPTAKKHSVGQKGNFLDVPTDCPQRDERLGWTGDAQVFSRTAVFNMNVAGFFGKWVQNLEDASKKRRVSSGAPDPMGWFHQGRRPAWADAGIIIPWTIYSGLWGYTDP